MWKRDEAVRPASGQPAAPQAPQAPAAAGAPAPRAEASQNRERDIVNIGKSVVIKGELNGSEDLTIEGQVEGTIQLRDHVLTIGANGRIKAQVFAKAVIVLGEVTGNVTASDKVDIRDAGSVDGDIDLPPILGIDERNTGLPGEHGGFLRRWHASQFHAGTDTFAECDEQMLCRRSCP